MSNNIKKYCGKVTKIGQKNGLLLLNSISIDRHVISNLSADDSSIFDSIDIGDEVNIVVKSWKRNLFHFALLGALRGNEKFTDKYEKKNRHGDDARFGNDLLYLKNLTTEFEHNSSHLGNKTSIVVIIFLSAIMAISAFVNILTFDIIGIFINIIIVATLAFIRNDINKYSDNKILNFSKGIVENYNLRDRIKYYFKKYWMTCLVVILLFAWSSYSEISKKQPSAVTNAASSAIIPAPVTVTEPATDSAAPVPQSEAAKDNPGVGTGQYHYVSGLDPNGDNWLALKAEPYINSQRIAMLPPGTLLEFDGPSVGVAWSHVKLLDGTSGWVATKYTACCKFNNNKTTPSSDENM